jgi:hypothetical protein
MKTVRYALGAAIGLTPALALAVPAAATPAAVPSHPAQETVKTVQPHHLRPATGTCVGQTKWAGYNANGSQELTFYYANHGTHSHCIGTVEASLFTGGLQTEKPRGVTLDIFTDGNIQNYTGEYAEPGNTLTGTSYFHFAATFQSSVANPAKVCAYWSSRRNGDTIPDPVCHTVG